MSNGENGNGLTRKMREDPLWRFAVLAITMLTGIAGASGSSWYFAPRAPISRAEMLEWRTEITAASQALIKMQTRQESWERDIQRLAEAIRANQQAIQANQKAIQDDRQRSDDRMRDEIDRHNRDKHK